MPEPARQLTEPFAAWSPVSPTADVAASAWVERWLEVATAPQRATARAAPTRRRVRRAEPARLIRLADGLLFVIWGTPWQLVLRYRLRWHRYCSRAPKSHLLLCGGALSC